MSESAMNKIPFVPLRQAAIGTHWSNRDKDGKHFKNYGTIPTQPSVGQMMKWMSGKMLRGGAKPKAGYEGFGKEWYAPCDMSQSVAAWRQGPAAGTLKDRVYFVGHATQLLCLASGVNILIDPIFSHRASPLSFSGPARRFPPATTVEQLPPIHVVAVSHNHYDHMDKQSLKDVAKRFPDAHFILPLKMERFLVEWGIPAASITTLDWYQDCEVKGVRVGCTPAQHWGKHSLTDNNKVLWCGWCIGWKRDGAAAAPASPPAKATSVSVSESELTPAAAQQSWNGYKKYFFTGDTAYNADVHKSVYAHFGPMDMAGLPIGAYSPRWFMRRAHIDPEHAVQIFQDQHIQQAMAVHWGTFELADEPLDEPPEVLAAALKDAGIDAARFQSIPMGKFIEF